MKSGMPPDRSVRQHWGAVQSFRTEILIFASDRIVRWALLLSLTWQVYSLYMSARARPSVISGGYYYHQSLEVLCAITWWGLVVVIGQVVAADVEWKTVAIRLTSASRETLLGGRLCLLFSLCIGVVMVCASIGVMLDLVAGSGVTAWNHVLWSLLATISVVSFWLLLAMVVGYLSGSFLTTSLVVIGIYLANTLLAGELPSGVERWMPVDNQRALLGAVLPSDDGYMIILPAIGATQASAVRYIVVGLVILIVVVAVTARRRSYEGA